MSRFYCIALGPARRTNGAEKESETIMNKFVDTNRIFKRKMRPPPPHAGPRKAEVENGNVRNARVFGFGFSFIDYRAFCVALKRTRIPFDGLLESSFAQRTDRRKNTFVYIRLKTPFALFCFGKHRIFPSPIKRKIGEGNGHEEDVTAAPRGVGIGKHFSDTEGSIH